MRHYAKFRHNRSHGWQLQRYRDLTGFLNWRPSTILDFKKNANLITAGARTGQFVLLQYFVKSNQAIAEI